MQDSLPECGYPAAITEDLLPWRTKLASAVGLGLAGLSRLTGRGSGSVIGGHAILAIDPKALERLSAARQVLLVSGTNGKTTTTKLLAAAIGAGTGPVVTNLTGANLPTGLVTALAAGRAGTPAVLEVDEAWLPAVTARIQPSGLVLLNLSRDQLDRNNEVRQVAQRWRRLCDDVEPRAALVANADDPLVAWAASGARHVTWVGAGLRWRGDATGCPACGGQVVFASNGATAMAPSGWACSSCGFSRPDPSIWVDGSAPGGYAALASGSRYPMALGLPGRCNQANAVMALAAAMLMGRDAAESLAAMAAVEEVAGRYRTARLGGISARLLLAKNPAGWAEVFGMLSSPPSPAVVAINARTADGHDPSWLWDVPFEQLQGRFVVATGERGLDLAVRLHYAGVEHRYVRDVLEAVRQAGQVGGREHVKAPAQKVDVVANYTAFHQLLAKLGRVT